ncbi:hypothetical protein [Streptomyces sp. RK75]|uniref:hypothetical protein n=1 Tax=Streptomyces sp. RK75 TaxID=2824895 RepID=UPI00160D2537|nr:hypothetical protein [Streptomyces sp. RK75]MBQ0865983.1 hypothetical protein [Streptomyces sp. RK75]
MTALTTPARKPFAPRTPTAEAVTSPYGGRLLIAADADNDVDLPVSAVSGGPVQ